MDFHLSRLEITKHDDMISRHVDAVNIITKGIESLDACAEGPIKEVLVDTYLANAGTVLGFDTKEELLSAFDVQADDYTLEGIVDFGKGLVESGKKVYRFIAELLRKMFKQIMAWITSRSRKNEELQTAVADRFTRFKDKLKESDENIENYELKPGQKIGEDSKKLLEDRFVFLDPQGRVLTSEMIKADVSRIVPSGDRVSRSEMIAPLAMGGKYEDILPNIKQALADVSNIISFKRKDYQSLVQTLMHMSSEDDFNYVLNEGIKAANEESKNEVNRLAYRGKSGVLSGKELIGSVYPTYFIDRLGSLKLHSMVYSYQAGMLALSPTERRKLPKSIPKVTLSSLEDMLNQSTLISSKIKQLEQMIASENAHLERYSEKSGKMIQEVIEGFDKYSNGRNESDLDILRGLVKALPRHHTISISHYVESMIYLDSLSRSIMAYVVLLVGK